ncbi:Lanthionine synthetase C family protein [[Clostridium] sordellii]|uniref:lanthionine synthetase C family protein n=1 Tax=Paraclostridium sordellii TaxID=1505 RepID=UPI00054130D9|nr:lanthionine synthetase C family protein [Paeniclostridium sordellii]CEK36653.1 Lanthionine synthetase C family protein,Nisin biosynthesis protein nisC,Lantibiotic modifying enzyme,type 2 lantibiotic biosynthesis protein LanM,Lanthionine synthetase C-like protein (plasmid) [[Clostridium] sordellii] [Paeniclostridium sordellii]CEP46131.1 Lanthionine synthetase C family protein [[Clostridium] sordellii] [Paeniclostridium sordellii]
MYKFNDRLVNEYKEDIETIILSYLDIIKDVGYINKQFENIHPNDRLINISAILLVLSKSKQYIDNNKWKKIVHEYMKLANNQLLETDRINISLYSGITNFAFSTYMISKEDSLYKKSVDQLNNIIVNEVYSWLSIINNDNKVKTDNYDIISGVSGIAAYLLFFEDEYIKECISEINKYLIEKIILEKEVNGYKVPGWYIKPEDVNLEDKKNYKTGLFNLGLAHGICSPLAVLGISKKSGIIVDNQTKAIDYILDTLNKLKIEENNSIFWNEMISFNEFIDFNSNSYTYGSRASWCYGTPGISRSMYIASESIEKKDTSNLSSKAFSTMCNESNRSKWMLNSPTLCHGYAGVLSIALLMMNDTCREENIDAIKYSIDNIIKFYDINNKYLFTNVEGYDDYIKYEDNIGFLSGSAGIILSLLLVLDIRNRDVFRIMLID